ncbi:unnamed protein product, partial [Mesorhabditis belari]|uniref:Organic solute transporter subunit alpha n=1 Tax=Mesorhabditis belari TaxID=2138241 RepID=A0A915H939_9BILA
MEGTSNEIHEYLHVADSLAADYWNCSDTQQTPSAFEFLSNLQTHQVVMLSIGSAFTIVVYLLAFVHWSYIWRYVSNEKRQNKLYWLLALFPISTACCLIGMIAPRTSLVLTSLGMLYYLICLFVVVSLCRNLFGGRVEISTTLSFDNRPIDFKSPPFCCFCFFLPKAPSTERNLRKLEWLVLQAPIVRAVAIVSNVIAIAEFRDAAKIWLHYSDMGTVFSLLLAIFGVHTMARATAYKLRDYCFMTIFRFVDVSLLFFSAQQPMIFENILLRFDLIKCGPILPAVDNARFVCNFVILCEMFCLSLLATALLAPERNSIFDLYRLRKEMLSTTSHFTDESDLSNPDEQGVLGTCENCQA